MDKLNSRMKALKRELDDKDEELSRVNAKCRKLQREAEDLSEANETLTRENSGLRNKSRWVYLHLFFYMCVHYVHTSIHKITKRFVL